MLDTKTNHGDVVVASLRSSIMELERLLLTIEKDDIVIGQDFNTQLKDVEQNIRILRRTMQESSFNSSWC
jgi:hypothetical protein